MALTSALNSQGATPFIPLKTGVTGSGLSSTPISFGSTSQGKALTTAAGPSSVFNTSMQTSTPATLPQQLTSASKAPAAPSQPIASQVHTDATGNSVKTTYVAPTAGIISPSNTDNSGGTANPNYNYNAGVTAPVAPQETSAPAPAPTSAPANSGNTYAGLISQLVNRANSSQSNISNTNSQIANLRTDLANKTGDLANEGGVLNYQTGRQGVLQQAEAAKESALQGELQNELTANGQNLTGLTSAAGLSSPANSFLQVPYSNQLLDAQGNPVGNGGASMESAVQNALQQIKNGSGYQTAAATLGAYGQAGTNALLSALGPNFNINSSNAQAAAAASNIGTQETLNTNISAQGVKQATDAYVAANTAYQTADQQSKNLLSTLSSTGINNNPQFVNQKINALQNQLGSANYASFITALNETKQAYTSLLSSVGASTPTVNGQQATDIFNANSTPSQIQAAIDALNTASYAKLKPLYDQIGTYSNIGGSSSSGGGWSSLGD